MSPSAIGASFSGAGCFFELQPQYAWPLHPKNRSARQRTGDSHSRWKSSSRTSAQEKSVCDAIWARTADEATEWVEELPVPVDAPGRRAQDPVLDQEDDGAA